MSKLPKYLQELKELEAKATPGQWECHDFDKPVCYITEGFHRSFDGRMQANWIAELNLETPRDEFDEWDGNIENAELIASMRNALPRILKEYAAMKEALHNYHWRDHKMGMKDRSEAREVLEAIEKGE